MAKIHTPTELAAELGISPKKARAMIRRSVRADGGVVGKDTPGKGKRYALDARTFNAFKRDFEKALATNEDDSAQDVAQDVEDAQV